MEYQASLLLCIPGNQIIVIELMSTHAQFFHILYNEEVAASTQAYVPYT
jgi:hypothetical protein